MIPVKLSERIEYRSPKAPEVTFYLRPLDPYIRAKIEDSTTEISSKVRPDIEPEVRVNWSLARYYYVMFGLVGWDWQHDGQQVGFGKEMASKWDRSVEVASEESIRLLQVSSLEVYNEIADAIRDNQYLSEEEAKNSEPPSTDSLQDSPVQDAADEGVQETPHGPE